MARYASAGAPFCSMLTPNPVISALSALAFTTAPHLQIINYRSGF
jgi:hypothetical protein